MSGTYEEYQRCRAAGLRVRWRQAVMFERLDDRWAALFFSSPRQLRRGRHVTRTYVVTPNVAAPRAAWRGYRA